MRVRVLALIAILALTGAACAKEASDTTPESSASMSKATLSIGSVPSSVKGNVVTLPMTVKNIDIVKPDGDTSGKTGHFHVFVDAAPVAAGATILKHRGIVHSADNPVKVWGLEPGKHTFTVVLGNGAHQRIGNASDKVTVDVKGPSVWGSVPATAKEGDDVTVQLMSAGVEIVSPNGSTSKTSGHFQVVVDPATPPKAGEMMKDAMGSGSAMTGMTFHTAKSSQTITGLKKGEHIIWIVLADGTHTAWDPPVMDKLTVTVT